MITSTTFPLIDSNILISFFIQDTYTEQARAILLATPCYLNYFVLSETLNFLQNKHSSTKVQIAASVILESPEDFHFLEIDRPLLLKSHAIMTKFSDNAFTFTDSLLLAQGQLLNLVVLTRDRRMQNYTKTQVRDPFQD
ncbi:MAG: type II toxin-antitoxin system VapC family toxin [bacterium]